MGAEWLTVGERARAASLRSGGWAVDIGIFGTNLFVPHVTRELEAGDGALWRLETPERER